MAGVGIEVDRGLKTLRLIKRLGLFVCLFCLFVSLFVVKTRYDAFAISCREFGGLPWILYESLCKDGTMEYDMI